MQLIPLGDCAVMVVFGAGRPAALVEEVAKLARALNHAPLHGVTDIVSAFATVTVHYDPAVLGPGAAHEKVVAWIKAAPDRPMPRVAAANEVVLPVCYGGDNGPDLAAVAARAKWSEEKVIRAHAGAVYHVAAVGFSPGFPYLLGLPARLATPRRGTPRASVPAGSVGIGGEQAGVYPLAAPGGWALIGRTPVRLFRPEDPVRPTLLDAGDVVRFTPITGKQAAQLEERPVVLVTPRVTKQSAVVEVLKPGALTAVQDLGRPGQQHRGVSVGGSMDRTAARVANLLLGNPGGAPLLELTFTGPQLRFLRDTWIAVTGARIRDVPGWRPLPVKAGEVMQLAEFTVGARAYLAFAGGLEIAPVLGGCGTDMRAGIGGWCGRALKAGDRLGARPGVVNASGGWSASAEFDASTAGDVTVRFIRGAQWSWFSAESRRVFLAKGFKVSGKSDRMGLRLEGPKLRIEPERELVSEGVSFGSVQVPPDGQPIVLMADRQTIGGYPKIAEVISVDLSKLAQARTGTTVRFQEIALEEAQALYREQEHSLALFSVGLRAKLALS